MKGNWADTINTAGGNTVISGNTQVFSIGELLVGTTAGPNLIVTLIILTIGQ